MINRELILVLLIWCTNVLNGFTQKSYTDFKPVYKLWSTHYLLDKIEYTSSRTIFHFRYIGSRDYSYITLFGTTHPDRWCLENIDNPSQVFYLLEIKNIRRNGVLVRSSITSKYESGFDSNEYDIYTCEVHFRRLPNSIKRVNFLEGRYRKTFPNHFHCLNVRIKSFNDPGLGSSNDMITRIQEFERKYTGKVRTKFPKPVPPTPPTIVKKQTPPTVVKKPPIKSAPKKIIKKPPVVQEAQAQIEL